VVWSDAIAGQEDPDMWTEAGFTTTESHRDPRGVQPRLDRDRELIEALRRGDPLAPERLVDTYGDRAYRLAVRLTRAPQDAEEVVQDALLTVVRKIDSFRGDAAFGSWVYRIVANTAYQKMRGRRRQAEISSDAVPALSTGARQAGRDGDWSAAVDDPARQTEVRVALTEAIDELPAHYRAIFVLRDLHGLSHVEIGQRLRLSSANVKTRIHRARSMLRDRLTDSATPAACPVAV
jgi:RNA polymerase sigma-70 factor (ECF subfamily)